MSTASTVCLFYDYSVDLNRIFVICLSDNESKNNNLAIGNNNRGSRIMLDNKTGREKDTATVTLEQYQAIIRTSPALQDVKTLSYSLCVQSAISSYFNRRLDKRQKGSRFERRNNRIAARKIKRDKINVHMKLLRRLTGAFVGLEALINDYHELSSVDQRQRLEKALDDYGNFIGGILYEVKRDDQIDKEWLGGIQQKLEASRKKFRDHVKKRGKKQGRRLYSAQVEGCDDQSIGSFVSRELTGLLDGTIEAIRNIEGNSAKLTIAPGSAIKALGQGKSVLERRTDSISGAADINTRSPIPKGQLQQSAILAGPNLPKLINHEEEPEEQPVYDIDWKENEKKNICFKEVIGSLADFEKVENVCHFLTDEQNSEDTKIHRKGIHFLRKVGTFIGGVLILGLIETIFRLPWQIGFVAVITILHPFVNKERPMKWEEKWNNGWQKYSMLRVIKAYNNSRYDAANQEADQFFEKMKGTEKSGLYSWMEMLLSGTKAAKFIGGGVKATFFGIPKSIKEIVVIIVNRKSQRERRFQKEFLPKYKKVMKKNEDEFFGKIMNEWSNQNDKNNHHNDEQVGTWTAVHPWEKTTYTTLIDFPQEIVEALVDDVIDELFRSSPAFATTFGAASLATFCCSLAPACAAIVLPKMVVLKSTFVMAQLSHAMMGQPLSSGMTTKFFSALLQWKLATVAAEGVSSVVHGDKEFINKVFNNSEKIVLGALAFIAVGYGLQYVPSIPTIPARGGLIGKTHLLVGAEALRFVPQWILEEAHETSHGIVGCTSLELSVLGLKSIAGLHAILASPNAPKLKGVEADTIADLVCKLKEIYQAKRDYNHGIEEISFSEKEIKEALEAANIEEPSSQFISKITDEMNKKVIPEMREDIMMIADMEHANKENHNQTDIPMLPKAVTELQEILTMIEDMEELKVGVPRDGDMKDKFAARSWANAWSSNSRLFYEALYDRIEAYNKFAHKPKNARLGYKPINKDNILEPFFNKYIYHGGSSGLMKFISWVPPIFVFTLSYRAIKYGLAKLNGSEVTKYHIRKSFAKEGATLLKGLAFCGRMGRQALKLASYAITKWPVFAAVFVGLGISRLAGKLFGISVGKKPLNKRAHDAANNVNLHHWGILSKVSPLYKGAACATTLPFIIPCLIYISGVVVFGCKKAVSGNPPENNGQTVHGRASDIAVRFWKGLWEFFSPNGTYLKGAQAKLSRTADINSSYLIVKLKTAKKHLETINKLEKKDVLLARIEKERKSKFFTNQGKDIDNNIVDPTGKTANSLI